MIRIQNFHLHVLSEKTRRVRPIPSAHNLHVEVLTEWVASFAPVGGRTALQSTVVRVLDGAYHFY